MSPADNLNNEFLSILYILEYLGVDIILSKILHNIWRASPFSALGLILTTCELIKDKYKSFSFFSFLVINKLI